MTSWIFLPIIGVAMENKVPREPMEILKQALRIAKDVGDFRFAGDVAVSIGIALIRDKDFRQAKRMLSMARKFYTNDHHPGSLEHSRVRLLEAEAVWAWEQGQLLRARALLHRARVYALKTSPQLLFRVDMSLSSLVEQLGKPDAALDYAREAYNAAAGGGYNRDRVQGLLRLYELYRALNKLNDAYMALEAALVIAQRIRDTRLIDKILKERRDFSKIYQPEKKKQTAQRR